MDQTLPDRLRRLDPITRGADMLLQGMIPGAQGQPHVTSEKTGYFCQEDNGEWLAEVVNQLIVHTPI